MTCPSSRSANDRTTRYQVHGGRYVFRNSCPQCDPQFYVTADNPESDIAGANTAGWKSILVHTGVYDPHRGPPSHQPTHQAEDVAEAVRWALEQEFC